MSHNYSCFRTPALVVSLAMLLPGLSVLAVPNNWTNVASGLWGVAPGNWSANTAPTSASNIDPTQITNAGTKTVTIDAATVPGNLSIRSMTLSAPLGATNTLALIDVPLGTPLTTSKPLLVGNRAILAITNSAVSATDSFDITEGELILDSGSLTCAAICDLQSGSLTVNSGTLNATLGTTGIRMGRFSGANANLTLNGGTVNTLRVTLGSVSGSQSSLTLAGGDLICTDSLSLAQLPATTGSATMTAGNLIVTNGTTKIADRATATFTQGGGNSAFANLSIGDLGVGTFNLNGGQMTTTPRTTNDLAIIGNLENGALNQSGGAIVIQNELHVADSGGVTGDLNITGGQFFATNDLVAIGRKGVGTMTVSNALVVLTNTSVGRHLDALGTLTVQDNASVFLIADLSIGRLAGSSGQVLITGGLLSLTNDDLWVGRGGTGDMTVTAGTVHAKSLHVGQSDDGTNAPSGSLTLAGGMTQITSNLVVGTSQVSTGLVVMAGGDLIITNGNGSARLDLGPGSFTLNAGNLTADNILLSTNAGQFTFNGGTIRAKSMTVANGVPFVVGDGVNPATLELQGGTYSFADGLVIAANATVSGCGTIVGSIANGGILNTNCGASAPIITALNKSGDTATIWFSTLSGANHVLEFKQALTDATWSPILPGIIGDGSVTNKLDRTATNATRFYRIKVQ